MVCLPCCFADVFIMGCVVRLDGLVCLFAELFAFGTVGCCCVAVILGPPSSLADTEVLWVLHLTLAWLVMVADSETPLEMFWLAVDGTA